MTARKWLLSLMVCLPAAGFMSNASAVPVDVELQLLVDVSGSVDGGEFGLQRDGYSDAFRSTAIKNAITGGDIGSIAAQLIYWSGEFNQQVAVDWQLIDNDAAADDFADLIDGAGRPFNGSTAPGSAINFGSPLFDENGYEGTSLVMDVSGDGEENDGADTSTARDAALADGVDRINGIAIGGSISVEDFYQDNIVGGPGSFLLTASTFDDFGDAVAQKLEAEITGDDPSGVPAPATALLLFSGVLGIAGMRRRRTA